MPFTLPIRACVYVVFRPAAAPPHQFRLYREHFRSGFLVLRYCLWHNLDICSIYWMTLFVSLYRRRLEAIVTVEHCIPLALPVTLVAQRRVAYIVELFKPCNLHTQTTCIIIRSSASQVLSSFVFSDLAASLGCSMDGQDDVCAPAIRRVMIFRVLII